MCNIPDHGSRQLKWETSSSVLPGIAFSLDLIETTREYGVAEVLLSSFMAAFIFSVFGAQPLTIAGVTGESTFGGISDSCVYNSEVIIRSHHRLQQNHLRYSPT